jgi:hypothetical protein
VNLWWHCTATKGLGPASCCEGEMGRGRNFWLQQEARSVWVMLAYPALTLMKVATVFVLSDTRCRPVWCCLQTAMTSFGVCSLWTQNEAPALHNNPEIFVNLLTLLFAAVCCSSENRED